MRELDSLPLTKPEAANILKVSASTIERMLKAGELRVVRIGRRCLVGRDSLERILQGDPSPGSTGKDAEETAALLFRPSAHFFHSYLRHCYYYYQFSSPNLTQRD